MINISNLLEDSIDKSLNGITNYFSKKVESLTNGFVRSYTLSEAEKLTFINGIFIDRCYSISDTNPSSAPIHNLDNNSDIAETVKKETVTWTLKCKFTSADHKEKYEKLLNIREKSQLVTLMFNGQVVENLAITNISRNIENVFYTEFNITLSKLTFVNISVIPSPKAEKIVKPVTQVNTGKETSEKVGSYIPEKPIDKKANLKLIYPYSDTGSKNLDFYKNNFLGVK